jgi:hypothetical protein
MLKISLRVLGGGTAVGVGSASLILLLAELAALFSLFAELVVLMLKLTAPAGLSLLFQVVSLIPMPAMRMKAMAPPVQMSGIVRLDGLVRVGKAGKLLVVGSTVTLLL